MEGRRACCRSVRCCIRPASLRRVQDRVSPQASACTWTRRNSQYSLAGAHRGTAHRGTAHRGGGQLVGQPARRGDARAAETVCCCERPASLVRCGETCARPTLTAAHAHELARAHTRDLTVGTPSQVLIAAAVDSWDNLREGAMRVLQKLSRPLAGCTQPEQVQQLLHWSMALLASPRVREADSGARLLCLVQEIYVADLAWVILPSTLTVRPPASPDKSTPPTLSHPNNDSNLGEVEEVNNAASADDGSSTGQARQGVSAGSCGAGSGVAESGERSIDGAYRAQVAFFGSLVDMVEAKVVLARDSMVAACRESFLHGSLLALRYFLASYPWKDVLARPAHVRLPPPSAAV